MPDNYETDQDKSRLRAEMTARRAGKASAESGREAGRAAAQRILAQVHFSRADIVSAYVAMREEIDPAPLFDILSNQGLRLALPLVETQAAPLKFRAWMPGEELVPGGFGTRVPPPESPLVRPTILIVPLLAFDRQGYRLGYGGGFFDRTLAQLRQSGTIYAIGLAYGFQEVETVPVTPTDQRLDAIATPHELIVIAERAA